MRHNALPDARFFFATAPLPCPYLPNRVERRVVTELFGRDAARLHDQLSLAGFRRSHSIVYAPACTGCDACRAVRIVSDRFSADRRSFKRIWRDNHDLIADIRPPVATEEQYRLFMRYQSDRHTGGDMAKMDFLDYQALVEDTPVETHVIEFRAPDGRLVAACLTDRLGDGLSAVYSFYDPKDTRASLGTYMILWLVEHSRAMGLPYVYLGFWIAGCGKMSYKARFQPLEIHSPDGWVPFVEEQAAKPVEPVSS